MGVRGAKWYAGEVPEGRAPKTGASTSITEVKLLSPTGHLGFAPLEVGSFLAGMQRGPDFVVADSGSSDIGPYGLGADDPASPLEWQRHDLEALLVEARRARVPLIVGSASDTGTRAGVDRFARMLQEIAARHRLEPFTLACIYADVPLDELRRRLAAGERMAGLDGRGDLTLADVDRTSRAVAVMGVEPILRALEQGADVIVCGRSSDVAIFAAPALWRGIPEAAAYFAGKVLECASFCAEPFMGKESVLGFVHPDEVVFEPLHPMQRCTPWSVASHAMYERATPYFEHLPGGVLDMRECRYEAVDERRTRVTGFRFRPDPQYRVKIEGAGPVGERFLAIVGFRDPDLCRRIDEVIAWARSKVEERYGTRGYELHYHVYGRDGVLGPLEPHRPPEPHELGVVVEGVAASAELAYAVTAMGTRQMFYARLPGVRGTAGTAALMSDEILRARPVYEWTINHTMAVRDPLELFEIRLATVDGQASLAPVAAQAAGPSRQSG